MIRAGLDPFDDALSFAQKKLAPAKQPFSIRVLSKNQTAFAVGSFSVFDPRIVLQPNACHLQTAYVVPKHRSFVVSGTPIEPFLVEAATCMMASPANWKNTAVDATPSHSDNFDIYPELNKDLSTILLWHAIGVRSLLPPGRDSAPSMRFIDVYGIGQEVYRGITEHYRQFIGSADMYQDVPYTSKEYIDVAERTNQGGLPRLFEQTAW